MLSLKNICVITLSLVGIVCSQLTRADEVNTMPSNAEAGVIQDNGELKGLQVSSLSFKLGYSW